MREALSDLWESWRVPALGLLVLAIAVGAQFDPLLKGEAIGALLLVPVVALVWGLGGIRGWLGRFAVAVGVVVFVFGALEVLFVGFPGEPIASAGLSRGAKTSLTLPAGTTELEVGTIATLASSGRAARGRAVVLIERDGHQERVTPEFSYTSGRQRVGRRSLKTSGFNARQVVRERVSLPGEGPIQMSLVAVSGSVLPDLEVEVRTVPLWSRTLPLIMAVAAFLALVIQVLASRRGIKTFAAAGIGVGVVLAPYLQHHFNAYDIGPTTLGALFVSIAVGGGGGMVACLVLDKLASARLSEGHGP